MNQPLTGNALAIAHLKPRSGRLLRIILLEFYVSRCAKWTKGTPGKAFTTVAEVKCIGQCRSSKIEKIEMANSGHSFLILGLHRIL
jgi:hypothetical protein